MIKPTISNDMMTGREYLESLMDGREIYIYGERVINVVEHRAFRNSAYSLSKLYDALHDSSSQDTMTVVGSDGYRTHRYFMPSRSSQELLRARDAIAHWSRLSYGFMGRTPDYKAGFTATLRSDPDLYAPFQDNANNWYEKSARKVLFLNHVLVNPPIGRARQIANMRDIYLHVEKETDAGIIVRGVKMVATSAALSNATFVAQNSATQHKVGSEEDFALCFILPMNAPHLKIMCRRSYEASSLSPFDHPLSSRFDENDSVLIFDGVLVPWENVLIYRDIERARNFYSASGFLNRYPLQSGTRLAVKMDFICGLLTKVLESNGASEFRGTHMRNLIIETTYQCIINTFGVSRNELQARYEHAQYSDFRTPGDVTDYIQIGITLFKGRTLETKRKLYIAISTALSELMYISPSSVLIVLDEREAENWGMRGGIPASEIDFGYSINI